MDEYLVVRAALRDELSRPMAEVRRLIRDTAGATKELDRAQGAGTRQAQRYEAAMGRLNRTQALVTGSLRRTAKLGVLGLTGALTGLAIMSAKVGGDYRDTMNEFGAVTSATADQLAAVGQTAKDLGSATDLANVSAADAAKVMTELAKGGLSVADAMAAAKGTLQLAGAAQIDSAEAATIQAAALNQFSLAGDQAGRVADVLANTANAAAGGVSEIGLALSYAGPVAASLSESIENTAASIGILSNAGVGGEKAGTALRAILAGLAAPSKQSARGLRELGIEAFDAQGRFKGLRYVSEQLRIAQGKLTEEQFAGASATAFGREPLAAVVALAKGGAPAFDAMATAVSRQGGAAEVAAAKTKGFRGAMENVRSQLETVAIGIYERAEPALERFTRFLGTQIGPAADKAFAWLDQVDWEASLGGLFDELREIWHAVVPLAAAGRDLVADLADLASTADEGGSALNTAAVSAGLLKSGLEGALAFVGPAVAVVGSLVAGFAAMPGPLQSVAVGLLALRLASPYLYGLQQKVTAAKNATVSFSEQMRVQQGLARLQGREIGVLGSAYSTLVARTGGLKGVGSALMGAFGGPVGLAITGVTIGLSLLASAHAKAKARAAENAAAEQSYADALEASSGAIDDTVKKQIAQNLESSGALKAAKSLGIEYGTVADAVSKGGASYDDLQAQLAKVRNEQEKLQASGRASRDSDLIGSSTKTLERVNLLSDALTEQRANLERGRAAADRVRAVQSGLGVGLENSAEKTGALGQAMGVLADNTATAASKANALRTAVDLLQGREVDLKGVQAQLYEGIDQLAKSGTNFSGALDAASGSVDVTKESGRQLNTVLSGFRDQMSASTLAAYQNAIATGQDLPTAYDAATRAGDDARGALVKQISQMGLNADQAARLADAYGLVTGDFVATIRANTSPADVALAAFQARWTKTPFIVQAQVRTTGIPFASAGNSVQAAAAGAAAAAPKQTSPGAVKQALGGLLEFYAGGGLRPMSGGVAQVVAPNTWRVIGDRARDDEAYIPINSSARSASILEATAARMGRALVPLQRFAEGGIASSAPAPAPVASGAGAVSVSISINGARDPRAVVAELEARLPALIAEIQRDQMERA